ncbi:hypothetical protein NHQ30_007787 [Ciborinia camelliae]|nr:hypothetical protein NHQ30_007787 [Ciborinia camelliae]
MSSLQSIGLEREDEFKEMMTACWEAFENPFNSYLRITFYLEGNSPQERERSIQIATADVMTQHARSTPNSYWMKVTKPTCGKLVGAVNWLHYERCSNTATSPEGIGREYANNFIRQIETRKHYLHYDRPYMQFRRHGVGTLMMDWGIKKADELGVDTLVEATETGKLLYEKYGSITYDRVVVNTMIESPSITWRTLERELSPTPQ